MYILIVAILCSLMLGAIYYMVTADALESVVIVFLLFVAIDTGLRAILNKPSWVLQFSDWKKSNKK